MKRYRCTCALLLWLSPMIQLHLYCTVTAAPSAAVLLVSQCAPPPLSARRSRPRFSRATLPPALPPAHEIFTNAPAPAPASGPDLAGPGPVTGSHVTSLPPPRPAPPPGPCPPLRCAEGRTSSSIPCIIIPSPPSWLSLARVALHVILERSLPSMLAPSQSFLPPFPPPSTLHSHPHALTRTLCLSLLSSLSRHPPLSIPSSSSRTPPFFSPFLSALFVLSLPLSSSPFLAPFSPLSI